MRTRRQMFASDWPKTLECIATSAQWRPDKKANMRHPFPQKKSLPGCLRQLQHSNRSFFRPFQTNRCACTSPVLRETAQLRLHAGMLDKIYYLKNIEGISLEKGDSICILSNLSKRDTSGWLKKPRPPRRPLAGHPNTYSAPRLLVDLLVAVVKSKPVKSFVQRQHEISKPQCINIYETRQKRRENSK
ncbi:hypothetical protein EVAR_52982_1 [Eumeta japonica]|uniref:Uncharacterized protein n=1 Tax=Eumeta variegata TaxID=151549 RepID=A0A4C1Z9S3_EUMVA|nr:hypothetical protein EVAR_52982_1 [Eumeta japonica]